MVTFDRRKFMTGGGLALAGASVPWLASCSKGSAGGSGKTMLKLSNDKATWKKWFASEGANASKAVGVGWTPIEYSDTNTYQAQIRTSGRSSKVSDLFTWWSGWLMKDVVDAGFAADVSSLWQKESSGYSQDLKKLFTFDGKTYGAPLYYGPWVTFYNKRVFDKYKLEPPTTGDELVHIMEVLKKNDIVPYGATIDGRWPSFIYFEALLIHTDPGLYQSLVDGKAKYTDPSVVDVMNTWAKWIKAGYFTDPGSVTFGTGSNDFVNMFKQDKAGMIEIGTWWEPTATGAGMKADEDFGAFIFPDMKSGIQKTIAVESGPLVVAEHGANKDDAMKALGYFMSKPGQEAWIKLTGFTSARNDVVSPSPVDKSITDTMKSDGYAQVNRYWEATPHDIVEVAVDQFSKFMLHPGDPMPILQAIQTKADSVWPTVK